MNTTTIIYQKNDIQHTIISVIENSQQKFIKFIYLKTKMQFLKNIFHKYPTLSKIFISGILMAAADIFTQKYIQKNPSINWHRNRQLAQVGWLYIGPVTQLWYTVILARITSKYLSRYNNFRKISKMIILDQIIFAPFMCIGFYLALELVENPNMQGIRAGLKIAKQKGLQTIILDFCFWPLANSLNFLYVPANLHALYVNVLTFFWNIILTYIAFKEDK